MNQNCKFCTKLRPFLLKYPWPFVVKLYTFVFGRPFMQPMNDVIVRLALHGRGYNNCCGTKESGEELFLKYLSKFSPNICIDVGANKGHYSRQLLKLTNAKVIAFEPLPNSFNLLRKLNDEFPDRFVAINQGLGDICQYMDLNYSAESTELASFSKQVNHIDYVSLSNKLSIKVYVNTLDNYLSNLSLDFDEIDLLKIDTEGFEYEVLLGAKDSIIKFKPKFIQIEYNWHQLFRRQSLYDFSLLLLDYKIYQILPHGFGLVYRDPKMPDSNIYLYSNFVFIRKDILI